MNRFTGGHAAKLNSERRCNGYPVRADSVPRPDLRFGAGGSSAPIAVANSPLNNLRLDVRILSTPELTVQTALAKLAGDVDLRLRGTAARPVFGRLSAVR